MIHAESQWLETFTVLIETGHFTRAAERLGMTQPGVSQRLRKLEDQVGQPLISRQGKSFSPTPAGEAILAVGQARRVEEKTLFEAVLRDDPAVGEVVVACSGSFAMLLYPHLFTLMRASPDLTIRLEAAPQDTVLSGVLEGRFDLGIADHKPDHPRLDAEHLGKEELCLVLPSNSVTSPIDFETLEDLGFVAHPDGFAYADELFSLNFPDAFRGSDHLRIRTFVNQISQIPSPVAHGIGYPPELPHEEVACVQQGAKATRVSDHMVRPVGVVDGWPDHCKARPKAAVCKQTTVGQRMHCVKVLGQSRPQLVDFYSVDWSFFTPPSTPAADSSVRSKPASAPVA